MVAAKLTEELLANLCAKVRAGVPFYDALASEGITNKMTPWRWKQRAAERPGSIYGRFVQELIKAEAENTVTNVLIVRNASTRSSLTTTTVQKRHKGPDGEWIVDDEEVRTVERPPDPQWAFKMLERRHPAFRPTSQIDVDARGMVGVVPKEVMARTIGEKLRLAQGGDPTEGSLLEPDDDEFRRLMNR